MFYNSKESGRRIAELRKEEGLTQEQLAEIVNVSVSYLGKIERGVQRPSIDLLIELAVKFNVSLDYIILGRDISKDLLRNKLNAIAGMLSEISDDL